LKIFKPFENLSDIRLKTKDIMSLNSVILTYFCEGMNFPQDEKLYMRLKSKIYGRPPDQVNLIYDGC